MMTQAVDIDRRDERTIYVAGASSERTRIAAYMAELRRAGWRVTVDWPAIIDASPLPEAALSFDAARGHAIVDLNGVRRAAVLWLVLPSNPSVGCWVELGYALGVHVPQVITSGESHSIFARLASRHFASHVDALAALIDRRAVA